MSPTVNLEKTKAMSEALVPASDDFLDALEDRIKLAAVNMLVLAGGDHVLSPDGYFVASVKLIEATLAWMLAEGYVSLTEKSLADEDERAKHSEASAAIQKVIAAAVDPAKGPTTAVGPTTGQYL